MKSKANIKTFTDDKGAVRMEVIGQAGKPGVGIEKIEQSGETLKILLTNGLETIIDLPKPEIPVVKVPEVNYNLIIDGILNKLEPPEIKVPTALEVAKQLIEKGLLKDGKDGKDADEKSIILAVKNKVIKAIPEPIIPKVDDIAEVVLGQIEKPKPIEPNYELIIDEALNRIKLPEIKVPTALEVAKQLIEKGLLKDGKDGKDGVNPSFADKIYLNAAKGFVKNTKGSKILSIPLENGFSFFDFSIKISANEYFSWINYSVATCKNSGKTQVISSNIENVANNIDVNLNIDVDNNKLVLKLDSIKDFDTEYVIDYKKN